MNPKVAHILTIACLAAAALPAGAQDAADIVRAAIDNWRGRSSYGEMTMTIHRPDWERTSSLVSWTRGRDGIDIAVDAPDGVEVTYRGQ